MHYVKLPLKGRRCQEVRKPEEPAVSAAGKAEGPLMREPEPCPSEEIMHSSEETVLVPADEAKLLPIDEILNQGKEEDPEDRAGLPDREEKTDLTESDLTESDLTGSELTETEPSETDREAAEYPDSAAGKKGPVKGQKKLPRQASPAGQARVLIGGAVLASMAVGAAPLPIPDAAVLTPIQTGLLMGIEKLYGLEGKEGSEIGSTILEVGLVTLAARSTLTAIKAIPGLNLAASLLNAIVAGAFTAIVGETTILVMEQIRNGRVDPKDLASVRKIAESEFLQKLLPLAEAGLNAAKEGSSVREIAAMMSDKLKEWYDKSRQKKKQKGA